MKKFINSPSVSLKSAILRIFASISEQFPAIHVAIPRKLLLVLAILLTFPHSVWSLSIANTGLHFQQGFDMYRFTVDAGDMGEGEDGIRDFEIEMNLIRNGKIWDTQTLQIDHFAFSEANSRADIYFEADLTNPDPSDEDETGQIYFTITKAIGKIDGKEVDFIKDNNLEINDFVPAKMVIVAGSNQSSTPVSPTQTKADLSGVQTLSGLVKEVKDKDQYAPGTFYLITQNGNMVFLGDGNKIWDNLELRQCINFAINNGTPISITGELVNQDGRTAFRNGNFTCSEAPFSSQYVSYEGCYGPKIAGFQLGISEPDTKNIIGEYAQKNNIRYSGTEKSLVTGDGKIFDVGFFGGKQAVKYQIGKQYFGVPDLQEKGFMQKFMREYKIPEVTPAQYKDMFGHQGVKYVYSNPAENYTISIFPNDILVESVK